MQINLYSGFLQIPVEEDKLKTIFFFLTGLYEFQIMPLELQIATVIFQRPMEEVLKKCGTTIKVCFAVVWQQRCS